MLPFHDVTGGWDVPAFISNLSIFWYGEEHTQQSAFMKIASCPDPFAVLCLETVRSTAYIFKTPSTAHSLKPTLPTVRSRSDVSIETSDV